jgi:alpha-L-rhamnosidase
MKPVPDKRLGHLEAEYKSAAGLIKSAWKFEGDTWNWTVTVPEGAVASITLPGEDRVVDYDGGTYSFSKEL